MLIWNEHAAKSVFMNNRPGKGSKASSVINTPRNAYASAQICIRSLEDLKVLSVGIEEETDLKVRFFRQDYTKYNDNTFYPDRLTELKNGRLNLKLPAHRTLTLRVDFYIPEDYETGNHEFSVLVNTDKGALQSKITLVVHKATVLPPQKSSFGHEYFFDLGLLPRKKTGIKRYSEEWWKLLGHYAEVMKELRNNTVCIQPLPLLHAAGSTYKNSREFDFRYDLFDRFAELFLEKGTARDFTLAAFTQSVEGKWLTALGPDGGTVTLNTLTAEADEYLRTFYGELSKHIEGKGWKGLFRVHIEDEPHTTEVWLHTKKILDEVAKDLLAGEPLDMADSARTICENCSWAVPRINVYDEDPSIFKKFIDNGGELWLYSCCFPEEAWFLNKFVDLPVIRSRLMEWAAVCVGARGFLHWGFNYWGNGDSLYGFNADARFKGDGAIVYPNIRAKKLDLSTRFMNTRDGLADADLFIQILEKGTGKQKREARELLDEVCRGNFEAHSDDTEEFEENYLKLLDIADRLK